MYGYADSCTLVYTHRAPLASVRRKGRGMRIYEGTVDEIVEYQTRTGQVVAPATLDVGQEGDPEYEPAPPAARATSPTWDEEDAFFIQQFVYNRAATGASALRIMRYLEAVANLETVVEAGQSERTRDGLTNYLMVRDSGPRRYGAIAYVKPKNGGLTLRLRPEHVEDLNDDHIQFRDVVSTQRYAINCPLTDDAAVDMAIELTRRALDLVRE